MKSGNERKNKTTLSIHTGYPETIGGNTGFSGSSGETQYFINAGINHKTKFQTKEHLRKNYENPAADDYYQYDRQDENLNNVIVSSNLEYEFHEKQHIGFSLTGSKKFNSADRKINYETRNGNGKTASLKEIDIALKNYLIDGNANYHYGFKNDRQHIKANLHYSLLDQLHEMNNEFYPESTNNFPELQNTYSEQLNKVYNISLDYIFSLSDSTLIEAGYNFGTKDLLNNFYSESYAYPAGEWTDDATLRNKFNYVQQINAIYLNSNFKLKYFEIQAGVRSEFTSNSQNNKNKTEYLDFFPSINVSQKISDHFIVFTTYNRRINRPTIKMLNPYTDEYADILNMHKGNPDLKPEYVNSFEVGNRFVFNKLSGSASIYHRNIDQAISRIKSASNDSALVVTFLNLNKAKLYGGELGITYKPFAWWSTHMGGNIFHTRLTGEYGKNQIDNTRMGWNINISNNFKLPHNFGFQLSGYYRSKLPSVMGTYKDRYYMDMAANKKVLKNKGQLVFRISDVFNTYKFGLDLDAIDDNHFRYSQRNRRKNESQYFILSFIYNINGKKQQQKDKKQNFFLEGFDK